MQVPPPVLERVCSCSSPCDVRLWSAARAGRSCCGSARRERRSLLRARSGQALAAACVRERARRRSCWPGSGRVLPAPVRHRLPYRSTLSVGGAGPRWATPLRGRPSLRSGEKSQPQRRRKARPHEPTSIETTVGFRLRSCALGGSVRTVQLTMGSGTSAAINAGSGVAGVVPAAVSGCQPGYAAAGSRCWLCDFIGSGKS